jgi:hypothetical protein
MSVTVDSIEIGVVVGSIVIERLKVLVVDNGEHDLLLGRDAFDHVFDVAQPGQSEVRVSSPWKDDSEALALELYPIGGPVDLRRFGQFLESLRRLHNLGLIAGGAVSSTLQNIDTLLVDDEGVPSTLRLKLTWIDSGSIWITLKSGSKAALTYVARFFETGATARLAQEVAASQDADNQAQINQAVRDETIQRIKSEQERLRMENLVATHQAWRNDALRQLEWIDDLLKRVEDNELRLALKRRRDDTIRAMVEQPLMPIVRNVPHEPETRSDFMLPPAPREEDKH